MRQVIHVDKSGGCHDLLTNKLHGSVS